MTFPLGILYLSYHYERGIIRREVRAMLFAGMDRDKLVVLSFSLQDAASLLSWKDDHEFEFTGRMYDVVETDILEDSINYLCWPDDEETNLNRRLDKLVAKALGSDSQKKESSKRLVDFLKVHFLQCGLLEWGGLFNARLVHNAQVISFYTSVSMPPASPPPKYFC